MAAGAVSLKLPNILTTSQDVIKGADPAKYRSNEYHHWIYVCICNITYIKSVIYVLLLIDLLNIIYF